MSNVDCLGKSSSVLTVYGKMKICDLKCGNLVETADSRILPIMDIISGHEREIIQLSVEGHEPLFVTKEHIVLTKHGQSSVERLAVDDEVQCMENVFNKIIDIKTVEYEDRVYSLIFEENCFFYANDILVSDFNTCNLYLQKMWRDEAMSIENSFE